MLQKYTVSREIEPAQLWRFSNVALFSSWTSQMSHLLGDFQYNQFWDKFNKLNDTDRKYFDGHQMTKNTLRNWNN